jgi:hypothetical protein
MSTASFAAAKIYVAMHDFSKCYHDTFVSAKYEPYRALIDLARTSGLHNIVDGSDDYELLVDCLETLICCK